MTPLEALADAVMMFEGWHRDSRSWRNRNPGNLRPLNSTVPHDNENYRIFVSLAQGFQALLDDLAAKFDGSHNLTGQSTMLDLLNVYAPAGDHNSPSTYCLFVTRWVSAALNRQIDSRTTLADFRDPISKT
jgi:hypothetical protein